MKPVWSKRVLAYNLRFFRGELGMSQAEVAKKTGLSLRSYQTLESGKGNPTLDTISQLAGTFELNPSRLFKLAMIRLPVEFAVFFKQFQEKFAKYPYPVAIRTVNGLALWANTSMDTAVANKAPWPMDIVDVFKELPETQALMRAEIHCEQRGIAMPYVVPTISHEKGKGKGTREYYRVTPTLILSPKGKKPAWTVTVGLNLTEVDDSKVFHFLSQLLECLDY
ncbi:MAG: helix-turn-helix domain-containing protein [Bdellovibrionota bacterium]